MLNNSIKLVTKLLIFFIWNNSSLIGFYQNIFGNLMLKSIYFFKAIIYGFKYSYLILITYTQLYGFKVNIHI